MKWSCLPQVQPIEVCAADWSQGAPAGLLLGKPMRRGAAQQHSWCMPPPHGHPASLGPDWREPRAAAEAGSSAPTHSRDLLQLHHIACWYRQSCGLPQNPSWWWSSKFWKLLNVPQDNCKQQKGSKEREVRKSCLDKGSRALTFHPLCSWTFHTV